MLVYQRIGLSRRSRSFLSASRSAPDLQVCAGAGCRDDCLNFRTEGNISGSWFEHVRSIYDRLVEIHFAFREKMIRYRRKNADTTKIIDWESFRDIERKLMIFPFSSSKNHRSRDDVSPTSKAVSQPGGPTCHGIGSRMVPGPGRQGVGQVRW